MRLLQLAYSALALSGGLLGTTKAAEDADQDFQLRQLTDDNFESSISQGLWLVEHYSPKCGHCRAFMPTWTQLAKDYQGLERQTGFHMAQINCLAQGDLCNNHGIKFYPQIILYTDGVPSPHFSGDRSYEGLSAYIEEHSNAYAENILDVNVIQQTTMGRSPNPEGIVLGASEASLEELKARGPVLVEFYAPWCGHCKKLRPTYEKVAEEMKGKLNVAAVDCDDHRDFCVRSGVKGYPTIRMLHHGTRSEFSGPRTLAKLKEFAEKAEGGTTMKRVKAEDFDSIVSDNGAFFLLLQTFDTTVAEVDSVKKALEHLLGSVPAYTSADVALYKRFHIASPPPSATLLAFSSSAKPLGSLPLPAQDHVLKKFITLHRFPTLVQLDSSNFQTIMRSDDRPVIVLGAVHKGDEGKNEIARFSEVARAWKKGGRLLQQPVWFVYVEEDKWARWLKRFYAIKKKDLPAVVVIDTPNDEYYDTTIEGNPIEFDGASIFSVLEGFYQHFLRPKRIESTLEWSSRSAAATLISLGETSVEHPFLALVTLLGTVVLIVYLLHKCVGRDPKEGHMPLSGSRLD